MLVKFFATYRQIAGCKSCDVPAPGSVLALMEQLSERWPAFRELILNPEGTEIGLLPTSKHIVTDVDEDVSRRHAYVWRQDDTWYIRDLGSTNGTRLISGADGSEVLVPTEPENPVPVASTDIICLGATTRFIAMPVLGS